MRLGLRILENSVKAVNMARNETKIWNRFSIIYDSVIKKDAAIYQQVIEKIKHQLVQPARILEVATGTGDLALGIASVAECVEAVDLSPKMIEAATKKAALRGISNVHFSVQDAYGLTYENNSFDIVIISNTLHILPEPERALSEIKRVLTVQGCLIAPTFLHADSMKAVVWSKIMTLAGFRAYHKWNYKTYLQFINDNGFTIVDKALLKASFPLAYVAAHKTQV